MNHFFFCFIIVGIWGSRPQECLLPCDAVISSLYVPAFFPILHVPCLYRLQMLQMFSGLLLKCFCSLTYILIGVAALKLLCSKINLV